MSAPSSITPRLYLNTHRQQMLNEDPSTKDKPTHFITSTPDKSNANYHQNLLNLTTSSFFSHIHPKFHPGAVQLQRQRNTSPNSASQASHHSPTFSKVERCPQGTIECSNLSPFQRKTAVILLPLHDQVLPHLQQARSNPPRPVLRGSPRG